MVHGDLKIFNNPDILFDNLVHQWKTIAEESIADHGAFHVALSGGATPRNFYLRLAQAGQVNFTAWDKVHIYFGDERCVPQDHEDSNYRMARETLFSQVDVPVQQLHGMYDPAMSAEQNAIKYANLLDKQLGKDAYGNPIFDLILLGIGDDGHTASLFPNAGILNESKKSVAAQFVDKLGVWRISLTYPTLNAARHVIVLVVGESKAEILSKISVLPSDEIIYPIQGVNPQGDLQWFLDAAAARFIVDDSGS